MSADNGIYILKTPAIIDGVNKGYEYRVAHTQGIECIDDSRMGDEYLVSIFSGKVTRSSDKAMVVATKMLTEIGYVEYGISVLTRDVPFPNMTKFMADRKIRQSLE